jgi:GTPase SAR1 family protein
LPTFLDDARALASPDLTTIVVGNKTDIAEDGIAQEPTLLDQPVTSSGMDEQPSPQPPRSRGSTTSSRLGFGAQQSATVAVEGREVSATEASQWASEHGIPVSMEVSALSGDNVDEVFARLARVILTKIELGEINPDDPQSGIQYGDSSWGASDGVSIKSTMTYEDGTLRRRKRGRNSKAQGWISLREWEEVFRLDRRRRNGCC